MKSIHQATAKQLETIDHCAMQRQIDLELEMQGIGRKRYLDQVAKARAAREESRTAPGRRIMSATIRPLEESIIKWCEKVASGGRGRKHVAYKYIKDIDSGTLALIAARVITDQISFVNVTLTQTALRIASMVEDEARFRYFQEQEPNLWKWADQKSKGTYHHRRAALMSSMRRKGLEFTAWDKTIKIHIGTLLIDLLQQSTGLIKVSQQAGRGKTTYVINPTPKTAEWLECSHDWHQLMSPAYMPCVVPPKDWTNPFDGGYWTAAVAPITMIKSPNDAYLEEVNNRRHSMGPIYEAINALQRTPFRININVLEVVQQFWDTGAAVAKIPQREAYEIPESPVAKGVTKKHMTSEQLEAFKQWKRDAEELYSKNVKLVSKRFSAGKILAVAERLKDEPALYFPHTYDFRGRIYAVPMFLNPQGDDLAKAVLQFSEGKPLGSYEAADWLGVHGANLWGNDKVDIQSRTIWAYMNSDWICACARDPFENRQWLDADKPWSFLAWCFEWLGYSEEGLDWVSRAAIAMDGSCNGLQHFSAALLDPIGGAAVNLTPSKKPQDIYRKVAEKTVAQLRLEDLDPETRPEDKQLIEQWSTVGINRKTTKRSVMVVPYSGTLMACRKYIEEYAKEREDELGTQVFEDSFTASHYLSTRVWDAIGSTVVAARDAMGWLQQMAKLLSAEELPINWRTPDGFIVSQAYKETRSFQVKTRMGEQILKPKLVEDTNKLNTRRQRNGVAPNWVHSMDGTALRMTVCACLEEGVASFAMIHDSYGTYACDTPILARVLREQFVRLYKENNVLQDFSDEVAAVIEKKEDIPAVPPKGDLDLESVKQSEFFFA